MADRQPGRQTAAVLSKHAPSTPLPAPTTRTPRHHHLLEPGGPRARPRVPRGTPLTVVRATYLQGDLSMDLAGCSIGFPVQLCRGGRVSERCSVWLVFSGPETKKCLSLAQFIRTCNLIAWLKTKLNILMTSDWYNLPFWPRREYPRQTSPPPLHSPALHPSLLHHFQIAH